MDDRKIIDLFFERSEQAISQLDQKYGEYCRGVSYNILRSEQDAEECVNDAYLRLWDAVPPAVPDPLLTYLCKIVRNVSLSRLRHNRAASRRAYVLVPLEELRETFPDKSDVQTAMDERELTQAINGFLREQTAENRVIFLRRYWFGDTYAQIGKRVGLSAPGIGLRLTKMRNELKEILIERGITV